MNSIIEAIIPVSAAAMLWYVTFEMSRSGTFRLGDSVRVQRLRQPVGFWLGMILSILASIVVTLLAIFFIFRGVLK